MSRRALIVIDIQNDYFPGGRWTLSQMDRAADNAAALIAAMREAGETVIHIRHEFPTSDAPFFTPGSAGAEIHAKASPKEGEAIVLKHHINSYRDTHLKQILDERGVNEVVICGAMSHMCVDAATRASNDFGYQCTSSMTHARRAIWISKASRCPPRRPTRRPWPRSGLPMPASSRQGNGWMSSTLDRGPYWPDARGSAK